jgi:hypothetical protein
MRPALALIALSALAACKPPPTDADMRRDMPEEEPTFASDPLPSPDTEGAMWAQSPQAEGRLIYGIPGEPALLAFECLDAQGELPALQITRLSPADEGAYALLALVGNGHIGRVAVDARTVGGRSVWQGEATAADILWEPLAGPRALGATVPGAGRVELNPSDLPGELIEECRAGGSVDAPDKEPLPVP